jgi:hypothetical protein
MSAKEAFSKLGYTQIVHQDKERSMLGGIQYVKRDPDSEMHRVGMLTTKVIEFYPSSKEILISTKRLHRDGSVTNSDSGILSIMEFKAVQKQIKESGW